MLHANDYFVVLRTTAGFAIPFRLFAVDKSVKKRNGKQNTTTTTLYLLGASVFLLLLLVSFDVLLLLMSLHLHCLYPHLSWTFFVGMRIAPAPAAG